MERVRSIRSSQLETYVGEWASCDYIPEEDVWRITLWQRPEVGPPLIVEVKAIKVEYAGWIEGSAMRTYPERWGSISIYPYGAFGRVGVRRVVLKWDPVGKFAYIAAGTTGRIRSIFRRWGIVEERRVVP